MWCPMPVRLRMRKHRRDWIGVRCRIPDRRRLSLDLRWILRLQSRCRDREGPSIVQIAPTNWTLKRRISGIRKLFRLEVQLPIKSLQAKSPLMNE